MSFVPLYMTPDEQIEIYSWGIARGLVEEYIPNGVCSSVVHWFSDGPTTTNLAILKELRALTDSL